MIFNISWTAFVYMWSTVHGRVLLLYVLDVQW